MSDKTILERAIHTRVPVSQQKAVQTVLDSHSQYNGISPASEVNQLGDYLRYSMIFTDKDIIHRFVVAESSITHAFEIIEECRLDDKPEEKTVTMVDPSGTETIKTTDVEKVTKEDPVVEEVVNLIQKEETSELVPK